MAIEDIKKELEQRFAEPLEDFYKRRIIFWNDEDGDFKEEVADLELSNAKILMLDSTNQFESKKILSFDDQNSNYLVYNPLITDPEHDWFLDIKLYSDEYRADQTSRWMQDMHIVNTPELRKEVKYYKGFFNAAGRRKLISDFEESIDKKSTLYMSMLSAVCGAKERNPESIIKSVILTGADLENSAKVNLLKYSVSDLFWTMVHSTTGFNSSENIDDLTNHVVLSAVSRTMSSTVLSGLESRYSDIHSGFCYDLVFNWIHSGDRNSFKPVGEYVTSNLNLADRFNQFDIKDLVDTDVLPVIDEVILSKLMHSIIARNLDADSIMSTVEKRRTAAWYEDYSYFYEGIYQVSLMNKFYEKHLNSFHHITAKDMWDTYASDYYQMDSYYREFHNAFSACLQSIHPSLDDDFKDLADYVEKEYKNWYLDKLASNWNRVIEDDLRSTGKITGLPHRSLEISVQNDSVKVLIDGHSSEMSDRDGILKSYSENSVALKYRDIINMKRDEKRAAVNGKDIVYIYHDTIDASSHNDESSVFEACTKAVNEIVNLVNVICSSLSGINIIITSDHGFLYTYQELNEEDKMERSSFRKNIIEQGRRYVITDSEADPDFLMPVNGIYNKADMLGFAPRENIRIKGAGGINFVHGGTSLQEMCVPVIKFRYLRSGYKALRTNKDKCETLC